MHFFLLLLIPAFMGCIIATDSEYSLKKLSAPLFLGFFSGIIVSAFIEFFVNSETNTGSTFLSIMLPMSTGTLIPSIILSALFIFFSKDDDEYKAYSILPLLGAFYSIYTPYLTLTQGEKDSFFMNFVSPVIYMETILYFTCAVKYGIRNFRDGKGKIAKASAAGLAALLVQPSIHALWNLHSTAMAAYITALLMVPASIFVYKFFCKR
ncbi:MAG: hypothetical protein Q4B64_03670 [Spirochaetales bacterium]|nr:hypothetical protein [Spirochaetales bacterium]